MIVKLLCIAFICAVFCEANPLRCPNLGSIDEKSNTKANLVSLAIPEAEDNGKVEENSALTTISKPKDDAVIIDEINPSIDEKNAESIAIPIPEDGVAVIIKENSASFAIPKPEDGVIHADEKLVSFAIPKPEDNVAVIDDINLASFAIPKPEDVVVRVDENSSFFAIPKPEDGVVHADEKLISFAIPKPEDNVPVIDDKNFASFAIPKPEDVVVTADENSGSFAIPKSEDSLAVIGDEHSTFLVIPKPEDDKIIDREEILVVSESDDTNVDIDNIENIPETKQIATVLRDEGTDGNYGEFSIIYGPSNNNECSPLVLNDTSCSPQIPAADEGVSKPQNDFIETISENTDDLPAEVTTASSVAPTKNPTKLKGIFKIVSDAFHKMTNENAGNLNNGIDAILEVKQTALHAVTSLVDAKIKLASSIPRLVEHNIFGELRNQ